ncbi:hypothetical protein SDRG_01809 [Saprolegnia diclina VS20]|uniref:Chromo domain-containing protein n=1 Tax=Saprolegnia diclina (strain VS20) TaxID=1156394 RepID=T0SCX4_SAPDV|nr:hypothetical protein SDRG_01809 [Saprolegnia diclina VS20]EQC40737.1 hypothetical protein SDRG_01809 [Saprolegnia diclina VS20]|eukprot:XP_008605581.1 hypothetical protein SDRG_01809 [Saprolegnia diclina VS20]
MQLLREKLAVNKQAGLQHLEKIILKRAFFYKSWSPKTKRPRDKESSDEDEKPSHEEQQGARGKKKRKFKQKDNKPPVQQERKNDGTTKAIAVKKDWKSGRRGGGGDGSKQGGNEGNGGGDKKKTKLMRETAAKTHQEEFVANVAARLVTWLGPFQITEVTPYSCVIRHFLSGKERHAHTSRLKPYAEGSFELTQEIREHVSEQGVLLKIREIKAVRLNQSARAWEILCLWEGLEDIEASWELFSSIATDAPAVARQFAEQVADPRARDEELKQLEERSAASTRRWS